MLRILTTSIIVLAIAVAAQAVPVTYTVPYIGTIDSSGTIQIPKYTGTESLVKVTLEMTATATAGSVTYISTDNEAHSATLAIGADLIAVGPTGGVNPNIFVLNVIPATTTHASTLPPLRGGQKEEHKGDNIGDRALPQGIASDRDSLGMTSTPPCVHAGHSDGIQKDAPRCEEHLLGVTGLEPVTLRV
jgi:hypothetical protein